MNFPKLLAPSRRNSFLLLIGNGVLQGMAAIAAAALVMRVFDHLGDRSFEAIGWLAVLAGLVVLSALLRRRERIDAEILGQRYVQSLRRRLYSRLLETDARAFRKRRKGDLLLKFVGDLSAIRRWVSLGLARLMVSGLSVLLVLFALAWLYWPFAVGLVTVLAASSAWIVWQSAALRAAIAESRRQQATLSANATEKLSTLSTVQAFGQAQRERRLMHRHATRLIDASVKKATQIGNLRAVIDGTAGMAVVTVFTLVYLLPPEDLTAGMVAAVISIIGFMASPLRDLGRVQEYWLANTVARRNIQGLARRAPRMRTNKGGRPLEVSSGTVVLENVSMTGVLTQINAKAEGGSRIAVLGANGSGKSTLLGLVGRLYDPSEGRISIDGQDISRIRLSSLRRQVAYVSSELALVRGSLRRNLCYGARNVDEEQLARVIADCALEDLIRRKPAGLDARVAESGADLSQGERIRLCLARALLRKPAILILDEAEANLDARAIKIVEDVIQQFPGTVMVATHRPSILKFCDDIWTLNDGKLQLQERSESNDDTFTRDLNTSWPVALGGEAKLAQTS